MVSTNGVMENYRRRLKVSTPIVLEKLRNTLKLNVKTGLQFFSINLKIVLAQKWFAYYQI